MYKHGSTNASMKNLPVTLEKKFKKVQGLCDLDSICELAKFVLAFLLFLFLGGIRP